MTRKQQEAGSVNVRCCKQIWKTAREAVQARRFWQPTRQAACSLNKRTRTLLEAVEAGGEMPLDFLLRVMRNPHAQAARRLEAAKAAAPFLHPKLTTIDAKFSPAAAEPSPERPVVVVEFVVPGARHT
jgi:hypothetical protein